MIRLFDQLAEADTPEAVATLVAAHGAEFGRALRLLEIKADLIDACRHNPADHDLSGRLCDIAWMIEGATTLRG